MTAPGTKLRIGLIGANFETGNMGVGALAAGAIRCLRTQWPQAEIYILDYGKQASEHHLHLGGTDCVVKTLNIRFSKKLYLANNIALLLFLAFLARLIVPRKARQWLLSQNKVLREISQTAFFAAISGGDSFSDIYGMRRFLYVTLPQLLIVVSGKELNLLPQTYGPFRSKTALFIASFIARKAKRIFARDDQSVATAQELVGNRGSGPNPEFRYDVGFALEPVTPAQDISRYFERSSQPIVGLNVSGLLYMGGYDRRNMFGLNSDYRELVDRIVELLIVDRGATVVLIPHVFGEREDSESDVVACKQVHRALASRYGNRLRMLDGEYNQGEIKHVIGRCDFFLGSRMHACIAAISQCVPAVPIAYSDKFIGVMQTVGITAVVADARKLMLDELLLHIEKVYDGRARLREQLERSMPAITKAATLLFSNNRQDYSRPIECLPVRDTSIPTEAANARAGLLLPRLSINN